MSRTARVSVEDYCSGFGLRTSDFIGLPIPLGAPKSDEGGCPAYASQMPDTRQTRLRHVPARDRQTPKLIAGDFCSSYIDLNRGHFMQWTPQFFRGLIFLVVGLLLVGAVAWRWMKGSRDEPGWLITKWIISLAVIALAAFGIAPLIMQGGFSAFFMVYIAGCGLILAILWTPNITAFLAKPFGDLIDGGDAAPEPEALYSIAIANRKRGRFLEAITHVRQQLERFPNDVTGQMLLAEIQADDLKDLEAAQLTIERFVTQEGHAPKNIAYALNALADWQIKYARDVEGARQTLRRIEELFPQTEEALLAAQRLSHMGDAEYLLNRGNRAAIAIKPVTENLGLVKDYTPWKPVEEDKGQVAQKYVAHLEKYPADMETREKLAMLYAEHYGRVDYAVDQIEQMIHQPGQPMKQVARCLNLLADIHITFAGDIEAARQALERIIELYPKYAPAENARQRIAHLRLEMKAHDVKEGVKMGTYEQNIGLKHFKASGAAEADSAPNQ
jgi:tetratricopeptide (TPR) repeat protein